MFAVNAQEGADFYSLFSVKNNYNNNENHTTTTAKNNNNNDNNMKQVSISSERNALGIRSKVQLDIININVISGIEYFREMILKSSRNFSETTPE